MAVKVQFQIGHSSKLRSKKTVEGFTHDWELYVKGINQSDISAFVEKIIFNLHESFQKPKRVCNKPPFLIQESGYAGFLVFIDIYFKNRDEPKKVQFNYDLDLQTTGPPQHRHEIKTFIFDNPSEEFRQKLLKNGGVPVSGVVGGGTQPAVNNNIVAMPTVAGVNQSMADGHKMLASEGKKHKIRPDDTRSNSFANLFGPPITKTSTAVPAVSTKHSPENKSAFAAGHATHPATAAIGLPVAKEKSSKDKEKPTEKSKDRSEKREKHHKPSFNSPHKEGRSESKKTDGSKHEKREKTEEKPKKDKSRDKDRDRERDKSSGANINNNSNSSKRPSSPKAVREQSPHKASVSGATPTNTSANNTNSLSRPASSSSGKIEEPKLSAKSSSKESTGENKSKETKQKESSSSSSSGKKSKKDKKDRDKDRDKEKRHEEREKQKMAENQQRSNAKEELNKISNNISTHSNNTATQESKSSKAAIIPLNATAANDANKKSEKITKQDLFKTSSDKTTASTAPSVPPAIVLGANSSSHSATEKKPSSSSTLNSNQNQTEKDKRSHKHRKKEKSKDKDRERDKERDKDKDKDREKDKDNEKGKDKEKDKEVKKEKEVRGDKHPDEKPTDANSKHSLVHTNNNSAEEHASTISPSSTNSTINSTAISLATTPTVASSSSSSKSSKNKEKKSKEKSSSKEEKLKHKLNDSDATESKTKQAKLSNSNNNNSINTAPSLSTSSSSSSVTTSIANAITAQNPNHNQPNAATAITNSSTAEASLTLDLSDADSLPAGSRQQVPPLPNNDIIKKPSLKQPSPINPHSSDSSNSTFPDLPLAKPVAPAPATKQSAARERSKSIAAPITATPAPVAFANPIPKEPLKPNKSTAKEKSADKPAKEEEKEKKRRRNSQAVNTFVEPPLKQLKTKEATKSVREKSKSPSLRNTGPRASISVEGAATFLQPSASPSSTAAAAPLPPPSSTPLAAHSPALSATEAVGNATSATANAATCNNSNSAASSGTNSTNMAAAAHHLPLEYLSELQELHHKIMTLQDNEDLQHVVELIAATGCYEITTKTFDFDLCKLDRGTVQRLQDFFAASVS